MRLEQLEYLIEVSKNPSISSAANKLHLTSQALSMSISSMEDELNLTLLERSYKGVQLTEEGYKLVDAATLFLNSIEEIQQKTLPQPTYDLSGDYELLTIAGEINSLLIPVLTNIFKDIPKLNPVIIKANQPIIEQRLLNKENEFAMFYQIIIDKQNILPFHEDLEFHPVTSCKLYAFVPNHFPISRYNSVSIKTLLSYPFILYENSETKKVDWLDLINYFGSPDKVIINKFSPLCQSLISAGIGVGLYMLPIFKTYRDAPILENVSNLAIRDDIDIVYGYLAPKNSKLSTETKIILDYISNCFT